MDFKTYYRFGLVVETKIFETGSGDLKPAEKRLEKFTDHETY